MKTIEQASVISEEDKALVGEIKKVVQGFLPAAEVLLYGSVARGAQGPESDYDILVLTDEPLSKKEKRDIERKMLDLELARDVILSTIYHAKAEWALHPTLPFHVEVEKHGIVL